MHTINLCLVIVDTLAAAIPENHSVSVSSTLVNKTLTENKYSCESSYLGYQNVCVKLGKGTNTESLVNVTNCTKKHSYHKLVNALLHLGICTLTMEINGSLTCLKTNSHLCVNTLNTVAIHQTDLSKSNPGCRNLQFTCYRGDCVSTILIKDGDYDCYDGSDEVVYEGNNYDRNFIKLFHCDDKDIGWYRVCDGIPDCKNKSDKNLCISVQTTSPLRRLSANAQTQNIMDSNMENCIGMFVCVTSGVCIPLAWVNDLHPDCLLANGTYSAYCILNALIFTFRCTNCLIFLINLFQISAPVSGL